jgi:hypothetical protein
MKIPRIGALLKMRTAGQRQRERLNYPAESRWRAILDRMRGVCNENPAAALLGLPGFARVQSRRIVRPADGSFQAYGRADWYQTGRGETKVAVESDRSQHWLWPYRITFVADDATGLLPRDVLGVMEVLPDFQMTMLELAFDFADEMTRRYVRQHLLFGKARPLPSVNGTEYWGTRKGMKRVQCYFKREIQAFRIEIEMRPRFLRHYHIQDLFDFHKLVRILPRHHIYFARFNKQKLIRRLQRTGSSQKRQQEVVAMIDAMAGNLWPTLNYLREEVQMKNTRRLLDPMPGNELVLQALETWAAQWPKEPTQLGKKKD